MMYVFWNLKFLDYVFLLFLLKCHFKNVKSRVFGFSKKRKIPFTYFRTMTPTKKKDLKLWTYPTSLSKAMGRCNWGVWIYDRHLQSWLVKHAATSWTEDVWDKRTLFKHQEKTNFFSFRIVNMWNSLPDDVWYYLQHWTDSMGELIITGWVCNTLFFTQPPSGRRRMRICFADVFFVFCLFVFCFFSVRKKIWEPFSGTAERIFMKLLPNDTGENGVCNVVPPPGESRAAAWRMANVDDMRNLWNHQRAPRTAVAL